MRALTYFLLSLPSCAAVQQCSRVGRKDKDVGDPATNVLIIEQATDLCTEFSRRKKTERGGHSDTERDREKEWEGGRDAHTYRHAVY
jgi:hypothetical protein